MGLISNKNGDATMRVFLCNACSMIHVEVDGDDGTKTQTVISHEFATKLGHGLVKLAYEARIRTN